MIITGLRKRISFRICLQIQADNLPFSSFPDLVIETSPQNEKSLSNDQINHLIWTTEPVWRKNREKSKDRTLLSSTVDVSGGWTMYLLADSLLLLFIWGKQFFNFIDRLGESCESSSNNSSWKMSFYSFGCSQLK